MPAGMGHQSGARGGSSTGWADRAHHMRRRFQRHGGAGSGIRVTKGYTTHAERDTHTPPSAQQRDQMHKTTGCYKSVSSATRVFLS